MVVPGAALLFTANAEHALTPEVRFGEEGGGGALGRADLRGVCWAAELRPLLGVVRGDRPWRW